MPHPRDRQQEEDLGDDPCQGPREIHAIVRQHLILEFFLRILQEPVPFVVGIRDGRVQFLKLDPSKLVLAHLNEPPHLGLHFLGNKRRRDQKAPLSINKHHLGGSKQCM